MADDSLGRNRRAARIWLRQQARVGRRAVRPVLALNLAGTVLAIGQAYAAAEALFWAFSGRAASLYLLAFALLACARAGMAFAAERAAFAAGAAARRRLRSDAVSRLLHAGPAPLQDSHSGQLTATVIDRVEALDGLFARWLPAATMAVAGPALVGLAVSVVDPVAALVLVAAGLLVPAAMAAAGLGAAAASGRQFLALSRLQARFLDRVRGVATIVAYGRVADEIGALAEAARQLRRRTMRVLRVAFLSSAALDLAAAAALVVLVIRYGLAFRSGRLAQPQPALFVLLLVSEFFAPLRAFAAAYQDRLQAAGASEALVALPPTPVHPTSAPVRTVAARGVTVAFEDVRLIRDPARGPVLDGLSFRVPAGETLVLAGPSGAGKSTVIEILLGFLRPDGGRVTVNGADIADLVPQALARLTAWVGQQPVLFAGTVRENIRFARPEATGEEVEEAARAARVDRFAQTLPQGLDTTIGEDGYGLSGGQAQRIAIARAFLKNAPVLLLDEPTAHLDPATETEVLDSLRRLAIGRTAIVATHSVAARAFGWRRLDIVAGRAASAARGAA